MSNAALLAVVVAGGRVGVGVHPAPSASAPAARRGGRHRRRRLQLVMLQVVVAGVAGVAGVAPVVGKRLLMCGRLGARGRAQLLRSVEPERGLCNGGGRRRSSVVCAKNDHTKGSSRQNESLFNIIIRHI